MDRSIVFISRRAFHQDPYGSLGHVKAEMLASDLRANERLPAKAFRLPRRLFRGRMNAYHSTWRLLHGAQPSDLL